MFTLNNEHIPQIEPHEGTCTPKQIKINWHARLLMTHFNYRTVSEPVFFQEKRKQNCSAVKMHPEGMLVLQNWQRTPELTPATAWKIWMTGRKIVSAYLNEQFCLPVSRIGGGLHN